MMSSEQLYIYSNHELTKNNGNTVIRRRRRKGGITNLLNIYFFPGIMYKSSSGPGPLISNSQKFCEVGSIMDPIFKKQANKQV